MLKGIMLMLMEILLMCRLMVGVVFFNCFLFFFSLIIEELANREQDDTRASRMQREDTPITWLPNGTLPTMQIWRFTNETERDLVLYVYL